MPNIISVTVPLILAVTLVNGDLFSSVAKLKPLVTTEEELLDSVQEYLRLEKQRLLKIERLIEEIKEERIDPSSAPSSADSATASGGINLGNPLQSYLLIRRLRRQWHVVKRYVADTSSQLSYLANFTALSDSVTTFPRKKDLTESIRAILRLQEIYLLKASDLADGRLLGQLRSAPLLASDCYDIGLEAWIHEVYFYPSRVVAEWMLEALRKYEKEKQHDVSQEEDTLRLKAEGLLTEALTTDEKTSIHYVRNAINITHQLLNKDSAIEIPTPNLQRRITLENTKIIEGRSQYFALCRGDKTSYSNPTDPQSLVCRYNNYNRPRLQIRPAKEEILATEPPLVLYHDMLTDREMQLLKERALPQMKQSSIGGDEDNRLESQTRVSNIAWLDDVFDTTGELGEILPRLEDYSNLKMDCNATEQMQVANYGLGGHYIPHYDDDAEDDTEGWEGLGRRIATVLYYLSDVEAGGATVFVKAGIRIPPVKGSAVFWYNYLKNGDRDFQTLHAGCPVLMGSKWASNLWIGNREQTFRRKCGLTQDDIY